MMKQIRTALLVLLALPAFTQCNSQVKSTLAQNTQDSSVAAVKTIIVDVRTIEEWNGDGHAPCTVNYPLDQLQSKLDSLKSYDKVVLVCRSGARAGTAKRMLEDAGFKNVENKGAWQNIDCKLD